MSFKVQIILILVFYKKVSSNDFTRLSQLPKVPPNLSLYRYEGNFYPVYTANKINSNNIGLEKEEKTTKPIRFTRYLNPVHLSHQIYHHPNPHHANQQALSNSYDDDATGSEYQVAMKVQPLQQVISSGKQPPQNIEESGKSHQAKRQLKIDIMSPEKMQSLRNGQNGFYNNHHHDKNNDLRMVIVPNKMDTVSRHYHDIFVKYKSPQELVFGHVLSWPELAQKRLEKQGNNNFKGQVIWADKTGGYGEHYWDLAQGAL
ncbi:uncharacterized protein LOC129909362 [Episyrphus balteatus]|uniref:uncharacterized protein LOC129909362 n=1 Tax=Episyrphus balteatus TaxID=286459 RepID=UPI00248680EE|nr:uncharacterized protein LOC129909362 [Episyrphus balteatus]